MLIPPRRTETELLEQGMGTLEDVRANLRDMWRLNRIFGGVHAITRHLLPALQGASQPVHVADIGAGSGELALHLSTWAARKGVPLRVYPLDISTRNLNAAEPAARSHPGVRFVQGDALALPFAAGAVDYFISSLVLHHFEPDALIQLLRHTSERAGRGIIMSDITRGRTPMAAFRLLGVAAPLHEMTRLDGMLSIWRAYTPDELLALARSAGLRNARVTRHFSWRMTLVAEHS